MTETATITSQTGIPDQWATGNADALAAQEAQS